MSDPPYMGTGLAEFVEGREFDVYIEFMVRVPCSLSRNYRDDVKES